MPDAEDLFYNPSHLALDHNPSTWVSSPVTVTFTDLVVVKSFYVRNAANANGTLQYRPSPGLDWVNIPAVLPHINLSYPIGHRVELETPVVGTEFRIIGGGYIYDFRGYGDDVFPLPQAPAFWFESLTSDTAVLRWQPAVNATSYALYRDGVLIHEDVFGSATYRYVDSGLSPEDIYTWVLKVINESGEDEAVLISRTPPPYEDDLFFLSGDKGAFDHNLTTPIGNAIRTLDHPVVAKAFAVTAYHKTYSATAPDVYLIIQYQATPGIWTELGRYLMPVHNEPVTYFIELDEPVMGSVFQAYMTDSTLIYDFQAFEALETPSVTVAPTLWVESLSHGDASLQWTPAPNATFYRVYRDGVYIGETASLSFSDTGLTEGQTYTWTVCGANTSGEGPLSAGVSSITLPSLGRDLFYDASRAPCDHDPTTANYSVAATRSFPEPVTVQMLYVRAKVSTAGAVVQIRYREPSGSNYVLVGTYTMPAVADVTAAFVWQPSEPLVGIDFRVDFPTASCAYDFQAYNGFPPNPPVVNGTYSDPVVRITWNPIPTVTRYFVYRDGVLLGETAFPEYLDANVVAGSTYSYEVTAENKHGISPKSAPCSVTVDPGDPHVPGKWVKPPVGRTVRIYTQFGAMDVFCDQP